MATRGILGRFGRYFLRRLFVSLLVILPVAALFYMSLEFLFPSLFPTYPATVSATFFMASVGEVFALGAHSLMSAGGIGARGGGMSFLRSTGLEKTGGGFEEDEMWVMTEGARHVVASLGFAGLFLAFAVLVSAAPAATTGLVLLIGALGVFVGVDWVLGHPRAA